MHQFSKEMEWLAQGELRVVEVAYYAVLWEELSEAL